MAEKSLQTEVQFLKGVGPKLAPLFLKLGLRSVEDVLFHIPRRYEDRTNLPPIRNVSPGQYVTVRGELRGISARPLRGGKVILKAVLRDQTGSITLTWFNQPWIKRRLEAYKGEIVAYGLAKESEFGCEINSPEYELIEDEEDAQDFAKIVPVYPSTEGLPQRNLRRAVRAALEIFLPSIQDPLPKSILIEEGLKPLDWCLREIHQPSSEPNRLEARKRLVFEEFLYLQVALAIKKSEAKQELGIAFPIAALISGHNLSDLGASIQKGDNGSNHRSAVVVKERRDSHLFESIQAAKRDSVPLWEQVKSMLPFVLTGAQERVIGEIYADMALPHPMNRLVQGDVGSGKTAVAAAAMLAAVRSGYQTALMAPTEILAEQHFAGIKQLFEPLGIETCLLVGKQNSKDRSRALRMVESGEAKVVVGTHAIIQEGVKFDRLGFVVIDEQHRFGVLQRAAIREKGLGNPDVLVMTATPIPRTLTMTLYGDLELSVIDELPPGRKPVKTHSKGTNDRDQVYDGVRKLMVESRQAYFVCPMVSESEKVQAQAAEDLHYRLKEGAFKEFRIGLLHGQMKSKDKEAVMDEFRKHGLDILVSTTVIEVGVDVPNASVMVIEDANRFGLSQLHQLRGRVGRGTSQSYCILISDARNEDARQRLQVMVDTTDGFQIAEADLRIRGPGEMAGTAQSGNRDFRIADLIQDGRLLEVARQAAQRLVEKDPVLARPEHKELRHKVHERRSQTAVITVS